MNPWDESIIEDWPSEEEERETEAWIAEMHPGKQCPCLLCILEDW